ncbi:hypothetical protein [Nonomuraea sp. NPDC049480]|uniref:hypothetical protein n=1 Tax=Nonomuraea sp. NPDC049480 TaxID=3364353 RepID=UPI00379448B0
MSRDLHEPGDERAEDLQNRADTDDELSSSSARERGSAVPTGSGRPVNADGV